MACHGAVYNNSMSMQKPSFGVIIGVAFLIIGAFIPLISSDAFIQSKATEGTLSLFRVPTLVLAALILIACVYRRSKLEISIISVITFALPFIAKLYAEKQIEKIAAEHPLVPSNLPVHVFNWTVGADLIWAGAVIVLAATLLTKSEDVA
jgi:hypothetical protein